MSKNRVSLIGRVGKDPEVRHLESGTIVANLSLATSESYKDKQGQKVEKTEWHNIAIFGKAAEIAEKYVKKGDQLGIEGKLATRSWEKDGITKYTTEIVVDPFKGEIILLGGNQSASPVSNQASNQVAKPIAKPINEPDVSDDLPF